MSADAFAGAEYAFGCLGCGVLLVGMGIGALLVGLVVVAFVGRLA
jgi:hypothetical protein